MVKLMAEMFQCTVLVASIWAHTLCPRFFNRSHVPGRALASPAYVHEPYRYEKQATIDEASQGKDDSILDRFSECCASIIVAFIPLQESLQSDNYGLSNFIIRCRL